MHLCTLLNGRPKWCLLIKFSLLEHGFYSLVMASKLTELEAGELQRKGQQLYREKKFQAALQRFNDVDFLHRFPKTIH